MSDIWAWSGGFGCPFGIAAFEYSQLRNILNPNYNFCFCSCARFLLKDGQLWLCAPQAKQIWKCLAENAVYLCDREACFKWYSKLMGDEPDLDPDINKDFFENNVLQLDPSLLTENGMKCFERFFKAVNCREGKLVAKRRAYMMDDLELIGLDYLWRVSATISRLVLITWL